MCAGLAHMEKMCARGVSLHTFPHTFAHMVRKRRGASLTRRGGLVDVVEPEKDESEGKLMKDIRLVAASCGWLFYHTYDSHKSTEGFPDLVLLRAPRVIFAELKSQKGRLSDDQRRWLEVLGGCPGVETYCWRPSDWPTITGVLAR